MDNENQSVPGRRVMREEAVSGGQKTGHIRWVLAIGTILAIAGVLAVWLVIHSGR